MTSAALYATRDSVGIADRAGTIRWKTQIAAPAAAFFASSCESGDMASRLERQGDNQGDTALIRWCNRHIRDPVWRSSGEVLKPLPDVHTDKFDYYPVLTQTNLPD